MVAAKNGNLNTIKSAYEEGKLDNLELKKVFRLSAIHNNLDIIKWGFEIKILDNIQEILDIASINENSEMMQYLILNYQYDNINIYNTFIISAFNGNNYMIEWLDDNYKINDITYITAYLAAYKNNWGICTKFISNKINKSYFNNFIIEDNFDLREEIQNFFNRFYKKINKNSDVNRLIRRDISYPTGDIIIEYHTRYPSAEDSEEDVYNIFIIYILYLFLTILFYLFVVICIYFYLFVVICIYFYLFIFNITKN
jgi:hypothetical protein